MRNRRSASSLRIACVFVGACVLMLCCIGAIAQGRGPGGPPAAFEKNEKAWDIEAKTIAQDLGLSAELSTKLAQAYKAARESHIAAIRAKMEQSGGDRRNFATIREVSQSERAKLETALKGFLNPEQTTKALATLGAFNRRWDPMVTSLDGMNLEEKKKTEAMKLVAGYVAESDKTMQAATASGDFQSVRDQMGKLKEKLDADLAKLLSAEQATKWQEETAMRRGGQRREGGPPPAAAPAPAPAPAPAAK